MELQSSFYSCCYDNTFKKQHFRHLAFRHLIIAWEVIAEDEQCCCQGLRKGPGELLEMQSQDDRLLSWLWAPELLKYFCLSENVCLSGEGSMATFCGKTLLFSACIVRLHLGAGTSFMKLSISLSLSQPSQVFQESARDGTFSLASGAYRWLLG